MEKKNHKIIIIISYKNHYKIITKIISYRLQFIDSARFMASSFLNLVNKLAEGIHKIKCKNEHDNKKM